MMFLDPEKPIATCEGSFFERNPSVAEAWPGKGAER